MSLEQLLHHIHICTLPKLNRNFEETESHPEFTTRDRNVDHYLPNILILLKNVHLDDNSELRCDLISSIIILYTELKFGNTTKNKEYSINLLHIMRDKHGINLDALFSYDENAQEIFDLTLEKINARVTLDKFKKYPCLIEVYCDIILNLQDFKPRLVPHKVLPISLVLLEDSLIENKIKGFQCCFSVLQCLSSSDFESNNYYDVLYQNLRKQFNEKDVNSTKELLKCLLELTEKLPNKVKMLNSEDIYYLSLEQLVIESNLQRKAILFDYVTKFLDVIQSNCIKKKKLFFAIIQDNLDACCNKVVGDILLQPTLECLQKWITYGWCVWNYTSDRTIISKLFRVLFAHCESNNVTKITNLVIVLLDLCTNEARKEVLRNLDAVPKINRQFSKQIVIIKDLLSMDD